MNVVLWGTSYNKNTKLTFSDDSITYESDKWTKIYPYGSIKEIRYLSKTIDIICKEKSESVSLYKEPKDRDEKKLIKSIVEQAEALTHNKPFKGVTRIPKEYYKCCNVCGNLFCYTAADLSKNFQHAVQAASARRNSILHSFSLNTVARELSSQSELNEINQIIDYDKCPSCGSKDLSDITFEEFKELAEKQKNPVP